MRPVFRHCEGLVIAKVSSLRRSRHCEAAGRSNLHNHPPLLCSSAAHRRKRQRSLRGRAQRVGQVEAWDCFGLWPRNDDEASQ